MVEPGVQHREDRLQRDVLPRAEDFYDPAVKRHRPRRQPRQRQHRLEIFEPLVTRDQPWTGIEASPRYVRNDQPVEPISGAAQHTVAPHPPDRVVGIHKHNRQGGSQRLALTCRFEVTDQIFNGGLDLALNSLSPPQSLERLQR